MGVQCGPCNDGICDWMPCTLEWLGCECDNPEHTTDQGIQMTTKKVLEAETSLEAVEFEYEGDTYTVPPGKLWPLECVEAQEEGKLTACVKALLGDKEYRKLREKCKTVADFDVFLNKMFDALDLDSGK